MMIVANNESHIENNMGSKTQQFGIEISPLLYKLMYSSMYEDKEQVVLQELSANALDAHKAAGKEHLPISITLPTALSPELVVQDFGVGMSYETVSSIYPSYGKSTKSHNNELTGGFGYGSKSPFALTDAFTVVTTHKGVTTKVACFLDAGVPNFTVFNSVETGEEDGTTVRVPISSKQVQETIEKKVNYLFWLWPVPPTVSSKEEGYFETVTKTNKLYTNNLYDVFKIDVTRSLPGHFGYAYKAEPRIAVGYFTYKIPTNMRSRLKEISEGYNLLAHEMDDFYVIPRFQIGELELSPSREVVEDTPENLLVIKERYDTIFGEVKSSLRVPAFEVYKNIIDLLYEKGVWLKDIVPKSLRNRFVSIDKKLLLGVLSNVLDNAENPLTQTYFADTVWSNVDLLMNGSEKFSKTQIIEVLERTAQLGTYFTKYYNDHTGVLKDIKAELEQRELLMGYHDRVAVLDFKTLMNLSNDKVLSILFRSIHGVVPNESYIHRTGKIAHKSAYFGKMATCHLRVLLSDELPSRIVNHTVRILAEQSTDPIVNITHEHVDGYKLAIDWCVENMGWNVTFYNKEEIEQNWASKPKATRTNGSTKSGPKFKINEAVVARLWKDGDFQKIKRKDFEETLVSAEDYIWIVKGPYCASRHSSLKSLMDGLLPLVQEKVKLFWIDAKQYNTVKISQILDVWSKYDVFQVTQTSSLNYPSQYSAVKNTWPLYETYASSLRIEAIVVSIFDYNSCTKRAYNVVRTLLPSLVTSDYAFIAPRYEYIAGREYSDKIQRMLPTPLLAKFLALRYHVENDLNVDPALELFTKQDKKSLTKLLQDEVITPLTNS